MSRPPVFVAAILGGVVGVLAAPMPVFAREAILLAPFAAAAAIDMRTRRIPNMISLFVAAYALTTATVGGQGAQAVEGSVIALALGGILVLGARGAFGMGDVKLLAAAGAAVGLSRLPALLLVTALAGGIAALAIVVIRQRRDPTMPYAPAIAAGVAWLTLVVPGTVLR